MTNRPDPGADVTLITRLRITDNANCTPNPCAGPYDQRANVVDLDFRVPVEL
jgi:hypothetical protein